MPPEKKKKEEKSKADKPVDDGARPETEEDDEEEAPPPKAQPAKKSLFALMADDDDDDEEEEEEADKKKKKKTKEPKEGKAADDGKADELVSMFGEKKKKKKDKEKKEEPKPGPVVCEVLEVAPVPKKDKLRLCKVRAAGGGEPVAVVTNAPNVAAGKKFVVALPGITTANGIEVKQAKVGGVESFGMFCGPQELGWATDVLDEHLAVMLADGAEVGSPAPSYEAAVEAFREREKAAAAAAAAATAAAAKEEEAKKKKGKKKGGKEEDDAEDLDAVLAEFQVETKAEPAAAAKGKKGKKGKAGKQEEGDDDFDALLSEFKPPPRETEAEEKKPPAVEAPAPKETKPAEPEKQEDDGAVEVDAKTLANRKKKDKKKGKAGAAGADDDDDFDALLAEEAAKGGAAAPAAAPPAPEPEKPAPAKEEVAAAAPPAAAPAAAPPAPEPKKPVPAVDEDDEDEAGMDAKTLANRKKKDKKKAKKGPVGGEGMWGDADDGDKKAEAPEAPEAAAAAPAPVEAAPAPKAAEAKKGGPKAKAESAVVRRAREEMERKRQLDEERLAFEAEQNRLVEEERKRIQEEEDREEAERTRKREARMAKVAKMKADGTYLTKTEKERQKRAAQLREQFGFSMDADQEGEDKEEDEAPAAGKVKKPMASKLKKKKRPEGAKEGEEGAPAEPAEVTEGPEKPKPELEAEPEEPQAAAKAAAEEEEGAEWEEVAEKILATGAAKGQAEGPQEGKGEGEDAEEGDDGEGSESGSSSGSGSSSSSSSFAGYRSPILVIMGHVDTGKTKLLDKIRKTNVQEGEAGGITQQIGATFFPDIALMEQTKKVDPDFAIEVPGIMVIDTPGHEAFNNLRARGSSLCDMAIVVIDIMHGLEPQTVESLDMLKKRKCFFVIALNKIDVCYGWNSKTYTPVQEALARQEPFVREEFERRLGDIKLQLNERGLNCALYWENEDPRSTVSIVPTSALTGEGVPDLLYMCLKSTQTVMADKLEVEEELQCTVIEVKNIEGLGTTVDVILVNGTLREGDQIVLAGMNGPIVTTIRALLTPQPMKEMRVKSEYVHHQQISTSMGVKICAPGLEEAVAGAELLVVGPDDDIEELKEGVCEGFESILNGFEKQSEGVYVKASTLGSLEALLSFLKDMKIPVFDVGIGEVHKKDVKRALVMKDKKHPEYAVILAFDVKVNSEAKLQAAHDDVQIMTADIIYHLQDKFKTYMEKYQESKKTEKKEEAVFPVILRIDKQYIFHKCDPIVLGCTVMGGQLRLGTPICVPDKANIEIGRVGGIEKDRKPVKMARRGEAVCVKIEPNTSQTHITYGRHFDATNDLYSKISRASIDTLKEHFKDEMHKEDWELIIGMKKVFEIS